MWDTQKIIRNAAAAYDAAVCRRSDPFTIGMALIGLSIDAIAIARWIGGK
jgi:hypothetical protein